MQTIRIVMAGRGNVVMERQRELSEADALPLFVTLVEALVGGEEARPKRRRSKSTETPEDGEPPTQPSEV